jgi:hypothetical protein
MLLRRVVDRIARNFNHERLSTDKRLTGKPRLRLQSPRFIEVILLELIGLAERIEAFSDNDMTGGTGT